MALKTATVSASLVLAAAVLAGCVAGEANNAPPAAPAPQVTTAPVSVRELRDWADFTGRFEAVETSRSGRASAVTSNP